MPPLLNSLLNGGRSDDRYPIAVDIDEASHRTVVNITESVVRSSRPMIVVDVKHLAFGTRR